MPEHLSEAVVIAQLTDPHLFADPAATLLGINTNDNLQGVLEHLQRHSRGPEHLLATGDLTQDGSPEGYARFLRMARQLQLPVHALPGNHDDRAVFHHVLGSVAAPVVELLHWRIVLLDSTIPGESGGHLGEDQLALLDALAQADDPRHVLLAMHHSPISLRSAWLDTMVIDNSAAFFAQLARYPQVRALLWGHVHQAYDGSLPLPHHGGSRTLRLMATPATCFQFRPGSQDFSLDTVAPGYRWLTLHADGTIETEVVRVPDLTQTPDLSSQGY
ncbi:MAG: 3',5'-cyclic-AMP phosphodiesterase [Alcaligenaceae bacterium]|nr:3',5'-cyclic-AMP phosphodiesterase [Alcaligenaceae bacterium]